MNTERYVLSPTAKKRRGIIRIVEMILCGVVGGLVVAGVYSLTVLALCLAGV